MVASESPRTRRTPRGVGPLGLGAILVAASFGIAHAESGFNQLGSQAQTEVLTAPPQGCNQTFGSFSGSTSAVCISASTGTTVTAEANASAFEGSIGVVAEATATGDATGDASGSAFAEADALWHENNFHVMVDTGAPTVHDPVTIHLAYGLNGVTHVDSEGLFGLAGVGVSTGASITADLNGTPYIRSCALLEGPCVDNIPAITNDFYAGFIEIGAAAQAEASVDGLTDGTGQKFTVDIEFGDTVAPAGIWATDQDGNPIPVADILVSDSGFPVLAGPPGSGSGPLPVSEPGMILPFAAGLLWTWGRRRPGTRS